MTNKELQEKLREFPADMTIVLYQGRGNYSGSHDVYEDEEGDLVIE